MKLIKGFIVSLLALFIFNVGCSRVVCEYPGNPKDEVVGMINGERVHASQVMVGEFKKGWEKLTAEQKQLKKEAFLAYTRTRVLENEARRLQTTPEELFATFDLLKEVKVTDGEVEEYLNKQADHPLQADEKERVYEARIRLAKEKYINELVQRSTVQDFIK